MESKDAELKGSIIVESIEENSSLKTESLFWNDSLQLLSSNSGDTVSIKDNNGSLINGKGFSADLKRKSFFFKENVEGEYVSDEN